MQIKNTKMLFEKAQQGDQEAFSLLYEELYTPLYRFILLRVKHTQVAEDLVQTVFLKVYRKLDSIDNQHPKAYFFTVAKNALADHWKKKKDVHFDETSEAFQEIADSSQDPTQAVLAGERGAQIEQLLANLPDEQRTVLELRFLSQLSNKEVATIIGKSEAAVRQIQCRALKSLRTS